MAILSGLIVSIDAFFVGISLGLMPRCRFIFLLAANALLAVLCAAGFLLATRLYDYIYVDTDIIVGVLFIAMGLWCFAQRNAPPLHIVPVAILMSVEAMIITMGLTLAFGAAAGWIIPITVTLAHTGYSVLAFALVRTRLLHHLHPRTSHAISAAALIIYGLMAIFLDLSAAL
jgi:putative Mn2+ efflux pump MntP